MENVKTVDARTTIKTSKCRKLGVVYEPSMKTSKFISERIYRVNNTKNYFKGKTLTPREDKLLDNLMFNVNSRINNYNKAIEKKRYKNYNQDDFKLKLEVSLQQHKVTDHYPEEIDRAITILTHLETRLHNKYKDSQDDITQKEYVQFIKEQKDPKEIVNAIRLLTKATNALFDNQKAKYYYRKEYRKRLGKSTTFHPSEINQDNTKSIYTTRTKYIKQDYLDSEGKPIFNQYGYKMYYYQPVTVKLYNKEVTDAMSNEEFYSERDHIVHTNHIIDHEMTFEDLPTYKDLLDQVNREYIINYFKNKNK